MVHRKEDVSKLGFTIKKMKISIPLLLLLFISEKVRSEEENVVCEEIVTKERCNIDRVSDLTLDRFLRVQKQETRD